MRGNPDNLRRAAANKSAATKKRAEQGIQDMVRRGQPVTFRGLARTASVSLDFLYSTADIRSRIEQLRDQQAAPTGPTKPDETVQESSVVRTLTAQLAELKRRHRDEVQQLRHALEAAHGDNLELRRRLGHRREGGPGSSSDEDTS